MSRPGRKGLKRAGMRSYSVTGPNGTWLIEREQPWRFVVRRLGAVRIFGGKGRQRDTFFQLQHHRRLWQAREEAEKLAGVSRETMVK